MVSVELLSDVVVGDIEHLAAQVHGNLACVSDVARSFLSYQIGVADFIVAFHLVLDRTHVETLDGTRREVVFQQGADVGKGDVRVVEVCDLRDDFRYGAFKLANVRAGDFRDDICMSSGTYRS